VLRAVSADNQLGAVLERLTWSRDATGRVTVTNVAAVADAPVFHFMTDGSSADLMAGTVSRSVHIERMGCRP
jgi:hypothetical protein